MSEITRIFLDIEQGKPASAEKLLPLVYDELRKLAFVRLANEAPGQTLQATALVHEAYLRLVDKKQAQNWKNRGHFFAAAGEAMRRILVERARAKKRQKRGGDRCRLDFNNLNATEEANAELVLAIHEALEDLAAEDEQLATLVKLKCFAGFSLAEVADLLGMGQSTAYEHWAYSKSRLRILLEDIDKPKA